MATSTAAHCPLATRINFPSSSAVTGIFSIASVIPYPSTVVGVSSTLSHSTESATPPLPVADRVPCWLIVNPAPTFTPPRTFADATGSVYGDGIADAVTNPLSFSRSLVFVGMSGAPRRSEYAPLNELVPAPMLVLACAYCEEFSICAVYRTAFAGSPPPPPEFGVPPRILNEPLPQIRAVCWDAPIPSSK